ncbi:hypothetical protein CRYUN_Cryun39dG0007500 [Craigia yunnanensis]
MQNRIETAANLGRLSKEICSKHKGFTQWNSYASRREHDIILQEKRTQHPHNFKAGAMNALIRVSSTISNGQIILNVDCDMYFNNSQQLDALCFFLDEEKGHEIAFVRIPQIFESITKNDIYARVADLDVSERYEKEIIEFGASSSSPMFTLLATTALLNLLCLLGVVQKMALNKDPTNKYKAMTLQFLLCSLLVLINLPLYQALYLRKKDKGKIPSSVAVKSVVLALSAVICPSFFY